MKIEKAEAMFRLMKHYGVAHFKDDDGVEIKFTENPSPASSKGRTAEFESVNGGSNPSAGTKKKTKAIPLQAVPPVESTIPHHVNEVASLLKLGDEALVDALFPDYSQMSLVTKDA